ncbi:type 3 dihydrofolate reductase [Paraglaciecola sp. MB-3u-78]|uniref:type 3 dihydrofolate reductase n=1 Tax=Paraglaciecola sp. MB-3u-78 TaxID=2058332 RepID=UPI000C33DD02|nr:type 3 dihydrofolate reductase [Paraglaciecola sp. MB-3u-78]PKH00014.1 type 3 dihydrofolate reductase [Paraglaciecola sp. MB-3u-78]
MIAAMANDRVIGADNAMPWHLPADLKHFKKITLGKPIIMGRKTYESIGKALPGRLNIVVSSDMHFKLADATVVHGCEQAIDIAVEFCSQQKIADPEVMIIGGGTIYKHFLAFCNRLYLTHIDLKVVGDTFFPDYAAKYDWKELENEAHQSESQNPYAYRFITLVKQAV